MYFATMVIVTLCECWIRTGYSGICATHSAASALILFFLFLLPRMTTCSRWRSWSRWRSSNASCAWPRWWARSRQSPSTSTSPTSFTATTKTRRRKRKPSPPASGTRSCAASRSNRRPLGPGLEAETKTPTSLLLQPPPIIFFIKAHFRPKKGIQPN